MEAGNNKRRSSHESDPLSSSSSHVTVNENNKEIVKDWNDLPEEILTSILTLLPSFADLASAASVSHPWNAAAVAASNNELSLQRPPLIVIPKSKRVPNPRCDLISIGTGPTSRSYRYSVISFETHANSVCAGRHFSKLILIDGSFIILHDVFTGEQTRSPTIAGLSGLDIESATLTAPLHSSSLSLVLVAASRSSNHYIFSWEPNGSGNRDKMFVVDEEIVSFALFKDQVYCVDSMKRVGVVKFEPKPKVSWKLLSGDMFKDEVCCSDYMKKVQRLNLVECDGELLIAVLINLVITNFESYFRVVVYKIDLEIGKWVKKEKLNNWCLFIDFGKTGFSCKDPEIWGGRSNCIYVAGFLWEPCSTSVCKHYGICPLNEEIFAFCDGWCPPSFKFAEEPWPSPFWVYPSFKSMEKVESGKAHLKSKKVKTRGN